VLQSVPRVCWRLPQLADRRDDTQASIGAVVSPFRRSGATLGKLADRGLFGSCLDCAPSYRPELGAQPALTIRHRP
jgi:hypothetical protein